ncbi:DNA adenine methylase [Neisseria subflava]|uniref:DNA adenine methylase n=1 Tax=Neisseria subflava TaxID=28449 RepID=UPI0024A9509E|nr:DNA adenine methylase [Neisseria subflava]
MSSYSFSPLRYPGGKFSMLKFTKALIHNNALQRCHYIEPYAGGAGLALGLMYDGFVSEIHINDIDPMIWSFWFSILNHTKEFIELINFTPITIDEWHKQKEINSRCNLNDYLHLGFSTFFLNRTNRSGIIKGAGAIGGKNQSGAYKIDCRFNKSDLIERIKRIKKYSNRIHLTNLDAIAFINEVENYTPNNTFFFIDPPYYNKGSSLYTSFYLPEDHALVADSIKKINKYWVVTYDNTPEIYNLYDGYGRIPFNINYSLQTKRKGNELLIYSENLAICTDYLK